MEKEENSFIGLAEHSAILQDRRQDRQSPCSRELMRAFRTWLALDLPRQEAELAAHLSAVASEKPEGRDWNQISAYECLVPSQAENPERVLFLLQIQALLPRVRMKIGDCRLPGRGAPGRSWIPRVLDEVHQSGGDIRVSLKALSHRYGASPHYLGVLFRRSAGVSFRHYVRSVRLCRAVWLLSGPTPLAVKEVAITLGFSHCANFCREFRANFGVSPAEYQDRFGR